MKNDKDNQNVGTKRAVHNKWYTLAETRFPASVSAFQYTPYGVHYIRGIAMGMKTS